MTGIHNHGRISGTKEITCLHLELHIGITQQLISKKKRLCSAYFQTACAHFNIIGYFFKVGWPVNAMLKLERPNTEGVRLVRINGPKIKFDRGPALAFNVFDWKGEKVEPVLVQKLADGSGISLSYGFLRHICFSDKHNEE
ncbi:uncharacterized protein J3R85_012669 [Psidium guajava]|nr:uncharacterized protein J3R85_012669 [Psidium guajava]